jgi:hypothetical protein
MRSFKNWKEFESWIFIIFTPIFISIIPFLVCWGYYGYSIYYYLFPVTGLIIGVTWANRVKRMNNLDDYDNNNLLKTKDLIETWEKEILRNEKVIEVKESEKKLKSKSLRSLGRALSEAPSLTKGK